MTTTDPTTPDEIVTAFIRRVEEGQLDEACALLAPDIAYENVGLDVVHGDEAVKGFLSGFLGMTTQVEWIVHRQIAEGATVANERTDRFLINGRWREGRVAGFFEVRDGRIALWRDYFDLGLVQRLLEE